MSPPSVTGHTHSPVSSLNKNIDIHSTVVKLTLSHHYRKSKNLTWTRKYKHFNKIFYWFLHWSLCLVYYPQQNYSIIRWCNDYMTSVSMSGTSFLKAGHKPGSASRDVKYYGSWGDLACRGNATTLEEKMGEKCSSIEQQKTKVQCLGTSWAKHVNNFLSSPAFRGKGEIKVSCRASRIVIWNGYPNSEFLPSHHSLVIWTVYYQNKWTSQDGAQKVLGDSKSVHE